MDHLLEKRPYNDRLAEEDQDEPLATFSLALSPTGEGNEFRTRNLSQEDWERRNVIERTNTGVHVYCDLMEVRHGTLGPLGKGDLGSLMVWRFRFDPQKASRRVKNAVVKIEFLSIEESDEGPEVLALAPEESWSLAAVTDHEEIVKGADLSVGGGASIASATGNIKRQKTTTRDVTNATKVSGTTNLGNGHNSGRDTVARWSYIENESRSTGVPDSSRVAVLLKRGTDDLFNAIITIEVHADLATSLEKLVRKQPIDDPVLFNPRVESKHSSRKQRSYDVENLSAIDLYKLCDVRIVGRRYHYYDGENADEK